MKERITAIIEQAPGAQPDYLEETAWFEDPAESERAVEEYKEKFERYRSEFISLLGEPTFEEKDSRKEIDEWYPEALKLSAWKNEEKIVFLALVHHDSSTPVAIELNCYTTIEIEELKE